MINIAMPLQQLGENRTSSVLIIPVGFDRDGKERASW